MKFERWQINLYNHLYYMLKNTQWKEKIGL